MDRLADEYPTSQLVQLCYHPSGSDPWYLLEARQRFDWYVFPGYPSCAIDGRERVIGGSPSTYNTYKSRIDMRRGIQPIFNLSGWHTACGEGGKGFASLYLHVRVLEELTGDYVVNFVVAEDSLKYIGKWYRFVVRDVLPQQTLTVSHPGENQDFRLDFTIDESWDISRLTIAAIVQQGAYPREVGQAIKLPEAPASIDEPVVSAAQLEMVQAYPNPFNPKITISYRLAQPSEVSLSIFDIRGRLVTSLVQGEMSAGDHHAIWDGRDSLGRELASGVYYYRISAGDRTENHKIVMLK